MLIKKRKYKELINKIEELEKDNRRLTELARIDKKAKKYKTLEEFFKKEDIQRKRRRNFLKAQYGPLKSQ